MRGWLWPANLVTIGLVVPLTVVLSIVSYQSGQRDCGMEFCDPHGYFAIFTAMLTFVVVAIGLLAFGLTQAHNKLGLVFGLLPAAVVAAFLVKPASLQPWWLTLLAGLAAAACVVSCIAGMMAAPGRTPLTPPPWPPHPVP